MSLDAEKAFGRVAWDYMEEVSKTMGLGTRMLSFIMSLYSNSIARVRANNTLSDAFPIYNGTRQGCSLSPILFILTLEPFLQNLRLNWDIKGIRTVHKEYKYTTFADDILLFLTEPLTTIPILLSEFQHFQSLSNLYQSL